MLRRLRGIFLLAVLWAVPWGLAAGVVAFIRYQSGAVTIMDVLPLPPLPWMRYVARAAYGWALVGGCSGALFALLVTIAERRRRFADLSLGRLAIWGTVGTLTLPVGLIGVAYLLLPRVQIQVSIPGLVAGGALGAASGVVTILLARRGVSTVDQPSSVAA